MTALTEKRWNGWRIARWSVAAVLLLTPLAMMQVDDGWNWSVGDFVFAGVMIGGVCLLYELGEKASPSRAYRAGVAIALATSFFTVWATLVRGDGTGIGFFLIIMAAAVGGFAARFQAAGMARTMAGVSIMHALYGVAIATAPSTANTPNGPVGALLFNGVFALAWLASAGLFHRAARAG